MGDICINIHSQGTFADKSVCFCYACPLPSHHIKEAAFGRLHKGGRPPSAAAALCGFLCAVAGKGASIAKKYRQIRKGELNMYTEDMSPIFLWNPYHPNHPIPEYKHACEVYCLANAA